MGEKEPEVTLYSDGGDLSKSVEEDLEILGINYRKIFIPSDTDQDNPIAPPHLDLLHGRPTCLFGYQAIWSGYLRFKIEEQGVSLEEFYKSE